MEIIRNRAFRSESLVIDNRIFLDCSIVDCILEYSGEAVTFERTVLKGCNYVFFGQAQNTVRFLQETGLMPYDAAKWAEMSDSVN